jgi:hypothetical protein
MIVLELVTLYDICDCTKTYITSHASNAVRTFHADFNSQASPLIEQHISWNRTQVSLFKSNDRILSLNFNHLQHYTLSSPYFDPRASSNDLTVT